jgi:hypothetical protein
VTIWIAPTLVLAGIAVSLVGVAEGLPWLTVAALVFSAVVAAMAFLLG